MNPLHCPCFVEILSLYAALLSVETGADMRLGQGWFSPTLLFYVRIGPDQLKPKDRRRQPQGM